MNTKSTTGKTKSQGWEIGVRRTLPITVEHLWSLLMKQPGLGLWFGPGDVPDFRKGAIFETEAHTTGEIRSYAEQKLIRMT